MLPIGLRLGPTSLRGATRPYPRRSEVGLQAIANPRNREQITGLGGLGLELVAELAHESTQVLELLSGVGAPNLAQQLTMANCPPAALNEHFEQPVLRRSEVNFPPSELDHAILEVNA